MTAPKLTAAQVATLRELAKGYRAYWMTGIDAYWFLDGEMTRCTKQIDKLITLDYLTEIHEGEVAISNAGRAYLAALDTAPEPKP